MHRIRSLISVVCVLLVSLPGWGAEEAALPPRGRLQTPQIEPTTGSLSKITRPYSAPQVAPVNLANSNRIDSLLRAGRLYLSLQDAIALALENNLDIELQRYGLQVAEASILRAQAGGALRGAGTGIQAGPGSAQAQTGVQAQGTTGQTGSGQTQQSGISTSAATQASTAGQQTGTLITQTGSFIPNLDPVITGLARFGHTSSPQTSAFVTGTNSFIQKNNLLNFAYQQGFMTGTTFSFGYSDSRLESNSVRADFNPARTGSFSLNITQKLLQGFGVAVNSRNIRIAKNQREVSDLVFKQQVIATVSAIVNLYWDLVSFTEDVRVRKQALSLNEKLYNDNKKQVEIGTLAPIEIVRAEAEVARAQQDLTLSETRVLQQETILKSALSRTGVASPALSEARVVPTDRISLPNVEPIEPYQDMVANALRARPELSQRRIQLENSKISLKGSRSQLLPTLDGFISMANNGLAGAVNTLPLPVTNPTPGIPAPAPGTLAPRDVNGFFLGGYNTLFSQLFSRNYPDYAAGVQLNIPLRNRSAQADMVIDQLTVRQNEIGLQQLENQVRVDVQNALIGLQQGRAGYQAATKARVLQEQTLDAEQKKYALGASTIFNVILVQRDLAQAQSTEVTALSTYSRARVEMDRATGETLLTNGISIEEAFRGTVKRAPSPLPAVEP